MKGIVRFILSCTLIGNRPQSLTGHTAIFGQTMFTDGSDIYDLVYISKTMKKNRPA